MRMLLLSGALALFALPCRGDLVSHYLAEGDPNDSVGTNHGTLINGATFAAGRSGQAFAFDGTDDFVQVADDATLDISPTITIAAWVSPDSEGASDGTTGILWKGDSIASPTGQSYVFLWTNSEVSFRLGSGSTLYETAYVPLPLNTFSHIAGTFDGSQMNLYVNGNLKTFTTTVPASINDSSGDLLIGTTTTSGGGLGGDPTRFFFDGLIDDVRIYDHALLQPEVAELVPEPATSALALAALCLARSSRRVGGARGGQVGCASRTYVH